MNKVYNKVQKIIRFGLDLFSLQKCLVLGDSHTEVFTNLRFKKFFPLTKFVVANVHGATASGLENPNSKTNAYNVFSKKLKQNKKYKRIILSLGEVDTGFVIWYRANKYGESVDSMLQLALTNYTNLIKEVSIYGKLLILSTPLPTITDDNDWGEIANLRRQVESSQYERTQLTLKFNKQIELFCIENDFDFINLDQESIGQDCIVDVKLLNKNKFDHHYDSIVYCNLLSKHLNVFLKSTIK